MYGDDEIDGWHFNRDGEPISPREWGHLRLKSESYSRVDKTHLGPVWVSTVWIGLDIGVHGPDETPMIFETMAFLGDDDDVTEPLEQFGCRYATETDARAGHALAVEMIRTSLEHEQSQR